MDSITVQDNGCGISVEDVSHLVKRHHSSKFQEQNVTQDGVSFYIKESFGFRGEALSAICACSADPFVVKSQTNPKSSFEAHYDHLNELLSLKESASGLLGNSTTGTCIIVNQPFKSLPVRFADFQSNYKREFGKAIDSIQSYAVVQTGIRISCFHEGQTVLTNKMSKSLKENIIELLGITQFQQLQLVKHAVAEEDDADKIILEIDGYISSISSRGRSSSDRQYLYINKKPVEIPLIQKRIQKVFRQFLGGANAKLFASVGTGPGGNLNRYPIYVLNLTLHDWKFDINVTPDKKKVFLEKEEKLAQSVEDALLKVYQPITMAFHSLSSEGSTPSTPLTPSKLSSQFAFTSSQQEKAVENSSVSKLISNNKRIRSSSSQPVSSSPPSEDEETSPIGIPVQKKKKIDLEDVDEEDEILFDFSDEEEKDVKQEEVLEPSEIEKETEQKMPLKIAERTQPTFSQFYKNSDESHFDNCLCGSCHLNRKDKKRRVTAAHLVTTSQTSPHSLRVQPLDPNPTEKPSRKSISISWNQIKTKVQQVASKREEHFEHLFDKDKEEEEEYFPFASTSTSNNTSITPTTHTLSKEDFALFEVIGQFNNGFIVGLLHHRYLYIFDQHASDERYNFETFLAEEMRSTTQKDSNSIAISHKTCQKLLFPKPVHLSMEEELLMEDYREWIKEQGYEFQLDKTKPIGSRIKLVSVPMYRNSTFDTKDLEDLLIQIKEKNIPTSETTSSKNTNLMDSLSQAPQKLVRMIASKACRKSIMIGDALERSKMKQVISNLSKMENPWCCPHGRPAMHLLAVLQIK